jgi:L-alanine-DL-glutamate epimerase-like enolase superfamily enzyme
VADVQRVDTGVASRQARALGHASAAAPAEPANGPTITDVRVVLHDRQSDDLEVFGRTDGSLPMGILVIATDIGIEGNSFLSFPGPGPAAIGEQIVSVLKPVLLGANPLDIGALWARMTSIARWYVDPIAVGVVDIALWDIAGKVAGLPIHRLLGTCREVVPVYFSSGRHDSPEEYAEEALHWREQGWKAYKLHPPTAPWRRPEVSIRADIEACTVVRASVGDGMTLMLDSSWGYSYAEALEVGSAIEELRYHWYEDPLPADDLYGYRRLKRHLRIPILATELTPGGLHALPQWIVQEATDFLRGDVVIKGGITGLMKIAHLAEAFHMNCEVHDAYNALSNVASLHVIMAIGNCEWFEVITFNKVGHYGLEHLSYGLESPIEIDRDGLVHAPVAAGLGYEVDWELIDYGKAGEIS